MLMNAASVITDVPTGIMGYTRRSMDQSDDEMTIQEEASVTHQVCELGTT